MIAMSSGTRWPKFFLPVLLCLLCAGSFLVSLYLVCEGRLPTLYAASCFEPASDAIGYWGAALHHAETGKLTEYGTHKPLFPIFVSGLIRLGAERLLLVHCVTLALSAAAAMLLALALAKALGIFPALWMVTLLSSFYLANAAGVVMSENLGFILGVLAAAMLLCAYSSESVGKYRLALFCQTLALAARSGPVLVLAALCLPPSFGAAASRGANIRVFAFNVVTVVLALAVNMLLLRLAYDRPVVPLWNFGFSLYGLSLGGAHWDAVYEAVPELKLGSVETASIRAFQLAIENIGHNPLLFLTALGKSFKFYLFDGGIRYFIPLSPAGILFQISIPLGLLLCLIQRRKHDFALFVSGLALILSLSFLVDGGFRARILAGVVPLFGLLSLRGLSPLRLILPSVRTDAPSVALLFPLSALLFALTLLPILIALSL